MYPWLDMPMHFLGGACIVLGLSILPFIKIHLPARFAKLKWNLLIVVFTGTVWEIFEFISGVSTYDEYFIGDTLLDYVMALLGAIAGYKAVKNVEQLEHNR
jgi:hypothetical protein